MRNTFSTIIMSIVIFLIVGVFALFGIIVWNDFVQMEESIQAENVTTVISESTSTIDKNIKSPKILDNPLDAIQEGSNEQNDIDYSNVSINKYFYNQLEEPAQTIYKAFETNKENMKTGTYKLELGNSFSSLLEQSNGQEILGRYYQSAIKCI